MEASMENIETFNVNTSFGLLIGRTSKQMIEQLQQRFVAAELGISVSHWVILAQLWNEDGLAQQEISKRSGVAKPNVTTMVDMLENENYIVRVPDQFDRRINRIFLTKKSKELRFRAITEVLALYETAFTGMTEKEKTLLLKLLTTASQNLGSLSGSCGYE